jgi:molybdenum cofactor guanylyltransferase
MGADKATLDLGGRPLIAYALETLRQAGLGALIAGNRPDLKIYADTIDDSDTCCGPLGGVCGFFHVTSVTWGVFVPVDLPFIPSGLITAMQEIAYISGAAVVLPSINGFVQSFPAVLNRDTLPVLQTELEAGRGGCFAAFHAAAAALGRQVHVVTTELLVQAGQLKHPDGLPAARWFHNINSAADLERARSFMRGNHAPPNQFA